MSVGDRFCSVEEARDRMLAEVWAENRRLREALAGLLDPPFGSYSEWRMWGSARSAEAMDAWEAKKRAALALLGASPAAGGEG